MNVVLAIGLLMTLLASSVPPQRPVPPGGKLWVVQQVQVEPAKEDEFEAALRDKAQACKQAGLGPEHLWVVASRPVGHYTISSPVNSFADLERRKLIATAAERAVGKVRLDDLERRQAAAIRTVQNTVFAQIEELSYYPKKSALTNPAPGFYHWTIDYVKPGLLAQYRESIQEFKAALQQAEHPLAVEVYEILYGSESAFVFAYPADNAEQHYALNKFGQVVARAVGKEMAARIYEKWRACLWKFEVMDNQPRPELSYLPALPPQNQKADPQKPAPAVEQLRHAQGRWSVTTEFLNEDGSVARAVQGTYRFDWVVPDRVLSGQSEIPELKQKSAILFYVNESKFIIEMVAVGADGNLWVMTGPADEEWRTTAPFRGPDGKDRQLRFTRYNVQPDSFESKMEYTTDGGKTWVRGNHQVFRRT